MYDLKDFEYYGPKKTLDLCILSLSRSLLLRAHRRGDMDPWEYYRGTYRREEIRNNFFSCTMRAEDTVGSYLMRLTMAFEESHEAGISYTTALRHMCIHLPNEWSLCAEQTQALWGKPVTGVTEHHIRFHDVVGFLYYQFQRYGRPPIDVTPFRMPLPEVSQYPRFRTNNDADMEVFWSWTHPTIPGILLPSSEIQPAEPAPPTDQPYVPEPLPLVETELARAPPNGGRDGLLNDPGIDGQQFGPIPTDVDFVGRLPTPPRPATSRERGQTSLERGPYRQTARMSTIAPIRVTVRIPNDEIEEGEIVETDEE